MQFPRVIAHDNKEFVSNVSETVSVSIIKDSRRQTLDISSIFTLVIAREDLITKAII
jgi:hypothetical protein